jgi:5,10-methylenetetrahydromethanopterin reductase
MKLGAIIEWTHDLPMFVHQVRLTDELGYDVIGVGDSPAKAHEMHTSMVIAAYESRQALLAQMVTTPYLRHPLVTATAMSSLQELTGGRAVIGIGGGGTAPRVVGRPVGATSAELHDYVVAVREICAGGSAVVEGRPTEPLKRVAAVPVYVAADHPRSLRVAGAVADGVVITVGTSVPLVRRKIDIVRAAAERAGRDPAAIDVWGFSAVSVRGSRDEANAEIGTALAADLGLRLRAPRARSTVPAALLPALEELERRYDMHDQDVRGANARLACDLGLVDFAVGRTAVTGDAASVARHLRDLEDAGVSTLFATLLALAEPDRTLRGLIEARELM